MYGIILTLAFTAAACQGVRITAGPTGTTQEIGSTFKLMCSVANKGSDDSVFWKLFPHYSSETVLLTLDAILKIPKLYQIENGTFNLIVTNATYMADGIFECETGVYKKSARVYIYDKPESITLDWEHSINKPGSVEANQEYKLRCTTKNSHPPAIHRYFKNGVELNSEEIVYAYNNDTDPTTGYGDVISTLPFTPSSGDVNSMRTIRCVADLYQKKNVSSIAFAINAGQRVNHASLGAVLLMLVSFLLKIR